MTRQQQEPTWPFLCVLAILFVLSVTAPRAWQRAIKSRPFQAAQTEFSRQVASTQRAAGPGPESPAEASLTVTPAPQLVAALPPVSSAASEPDRFSPASTELEAAAPAGKIASKPIDWSLPEEPPQDATALARAPNFEEGEGGIGSAQVSEKLSPVDPTLHEEQPPVQPQTPADDRDMNGVDGVFVILPENFAPTAEAVSPKTWLEPVALEQCLDRLAWDCETGDWARETSRLTRKLLAAMAAGSAEAGSIFAQLDELGRQAEPLAASLGEDPRAMDVWRAQWALGRRLEIWQAVVRAGGPLATVGQAAATDRRQLQSRLADVEVFLGDSAEGRLWRKYLGIDALRKLSAGAAADQKPLERQMIREVVRRLTRPDMSGEQRRFLAAGPIARLAAELRAWAGGRVDLAEMLRHLERYEATGLSSDARLLAIDSVCLEASPAEEHQALARKIGAFYRNANLRIVGTDDLLNRLMPDRQPEYQWVRDTVLGLPVEGRSVTSANVRVQLIPDAKRLRMALAVDGLVSALTSSTSGPATFYSDSESTYRAVKPIEIDLAGLHFEPAEVQVNNQMWLRGLRTDFDIIPLVGSLVRDVALSQHEKKRPEITQEVEQKVYLRAKRQVDEETDARLAELSERFQSRVLQPLAELDLGPSVVKAGTTEHRLTMELRLASDEQLASHTLRPWAPADSLASCQIHESALNNLAEQMQLDGGSFTVAELRQRIAERLHRPEMLQAESENDDVRISFAPKDAVQVRCRDGLMIISLAVVSLEKSPRRWNNFQVLAFYRPEINGRSARLVRDGVVQLIGSADTGSQIALRGIFSKIFSKERPWEIVPESLVNDSRMQGMGVTQFVIADGWFSLAMGPDRMPAVAQRETESRQ